MSILCRFEIFSLFSQNLKRSRDPDHAHWVACLHHYKPTQYTVHDDKEHHVVYLGQLFWTISMNVGLCKYYEVPGLSMHVVT